MQIVIDIPEDYYKAIKEIPIEQSTADMMIIRNGIPHETVTEFADRCRECGARYGKLLKQEPCKDAVSRKAVLNTLDKMDKALDENRTIEEYKELLRECYEQLTPVKVREDAVSRTEYGTDGNLYRLTISNGKEFERSCCDAVSRQAVEEAIYDATNSMDLNYEQIIAYIDKLPSVYPAEKVGRCIDCKWWKDSDGLYRRGGHAESQCPINRREVLEGNGYCYMFETQESEE